ncbi:formate dehydrogenase accessory sulfurtransferase FdhD [Diaphorobacter caeni]|uniref:formate dehydrogenase accessory sulfurtransferase FdhD n=1 Tax=Diaphorobacter caeni TaxID=2784387 RepID=UPI00188DFA08|nr:formate dehydrogenase accessory sulfurtransferase FdhD [Diaphorobacter caeni]MBF5007130.1 formate dehydrogenase accessory sulfurtransferase FdhD [Diaphorobacter caeni]
MTQPVVHGVSSGAQSVAVSAYRGGVLRRVADWLADEVPVALVFNGISHAVMLVTPNDLEEFALGFGLTEGLLVDAAELYGVEVLPTCDGLEIQMEVSAACAFRLKERRRNLAGRTGCGLCGTESLEHVRRPLPVFKENECVWVSPGALARALQSMREAQVLQQATGAMHAAAWCDPQGKAQIVREDVGRHNALDKLAGAMVRASVDPVLGFVCVTSRASFEMVQKTAMIGASMLVAVSAPTAHAVRVASDCGLALAGFARQEDFVAYTDAQRFGFPEDAAGLSCLH